MKVNKLLLNGNVAYYFIPILIVMFSLQIVVAESESINEKLWDAVDVEDESLVKQLLEQGADGGAVVGRGSIGTYLNSDMSVPYIYSANTALKQAVNKGSSALVRLLLEAGVEDEDNAAFIHAVRSLHTDVVRDFLISRSDNMYDWDSPIVCDSKSCRSKYQGQLGEQLTRLLIANDGDIELRSLFAQVGLEVDNKGLSPEKAAINEKLWDAVDVEDESLFKQLLEQGADGGAVVGRGSIGMYFNSDMSVAYMYSANTALKQAVDKGSSALVRLLLEAGVEDEDNAAFIHAVRSLHTDVVRDFLISRSDNMYDWDSPIVCDSKSCRSKYQGQLGEQLTRLLIANDGDIELRSLFAQVGLEVDTKGLSPEEAN